MWAVGAALFALGAIGGTQAVRTRWMPLRHWPPSPCRPSRPLRRPPCPPTKKVTTPGPTVTVTETAQAAGTSDSAGGSSDSGSGTCSIVYKAGNCYQAGQYHRNSDRGATTTAAGGTRITCTYRSNAWRWAYS
ncbi:hypothetical protein ACIQW4_20160 [Streptomyces albogriseolus]|uniref:hypothetical protein n=1 Tax=Streptomyces albogriseolus TaxID=1887 RepID=UPI00380D0BC8